MKNAPHRSPKEIYLHYGCSFFHMHREGDYDEYKSHGIPEAQESKWRDEHRIDLLGKLKSDPSSGHITSMYSSTIDMPREEELIVPLLLLLDELKEKMDSFSKLLNAEALIEVMKRTRRSSTVHTRSEKLIVSLLSSVMAEPERIDARYREIPYLTRTIGRDAIVERARKSLNT